MESTETCWCEKPMRLFRINEDRELLVCETITDKDELAGLKTAAETSDVLPTLHRSFARDAL